MKKRVLSLILAFLMLVSPLGGVKAFAEGEITYKVETNPTTLTAKTDEQTVELKFSTTEPLELNSIELYVNIPTGWTLTGLNNESVGGFNPDSDINLETGKVVWDNGAVAVTVSELVTATFTVPANTSGEVSVGLTEIILCHVEGINIDYLADEEDYNTTVNFQAAATPVDKPADESAWEIYYELYESSADGAAKITTDTEGATGYIDYEANADGTLPTVTAKVFLQPDSAQILQAYDVYVTNSDKLKIKSITAADGASVTDDHAALKSTDTLAHIQAIGGENAEIQVPVDNTAPYLLATIEYEFTDAAKQGEQYDITISTADGAQKTTVAIGSTRLPRYPAVPADNVSGVEIVTERTVTYHENNGTYAVTGMPAGSPFTVGYNNEHTVAAAPSSEGFEFLGWSETEGANTQAQVEYAPNATFNVLVDTDLYAVWKANKHMVTFVDWDDTVLKAAKEYDHGTKKENIEVPADPTRADDVAKTYEFAGWNPALADVTEDVTYKATYTETTRQYEITFVDEDGTTVLKEATKYAYNTPAEDIVKPAEPSKEPTATKTYTFAGWTPALAPVTQDQTYTASYTEADRQYDITFDLGDGSWKDSFTPPEKYTCGTALTLPTGDNITPPTGYTFGGWDDGTGNIVTKIPADATGDKTFTAVWTPWQTTIHFNGNGNTNTSVTMAEQVVEYNKADQKLTANAFEKVDGDITYTFAGWSLTQGSTTADFADQADILTQPSIFTGATAEVTLYAVWEQATYPINYVLSGHGQLPATYPTTHSATAETVVNVTLENVPGYEFRGWTTTDFPGYTTPTNPVTVPANLEQAVTLTAVWEAVDVGYHVRHMGQNIRGEGYTELEMENIATGKDGETTNAQAKTFEGFTAPTAEQVAAAQTSIAADGSTTVTLNYTRNQYTVSYSVSGDVPEDYNKPADQANVWFEQEVTVAEKPDVEGYEFTGWTNDASLTPDANRKVNMPAQDVTFSGTFTALDRNYTVKHMIEKLDGTYEQSGEVDTLTGKTGSDTQAVARTITGFTAGTVPVLKIKGDGSTVVEILYTRNSYNVTYTVTGTIPTGAPDAPAAKSYKFEQQVEREPALSLTGYTFNGWTTENTITIEDGKFTMPAEDVTFTGSWEKTTYTITFENGEGATTSDAITYTFDQDITLPAAPTKELYSFVNWTVKETSGTWTAGTTYEAEQAINAGMNGSVTLVANWNFATSSVEAFRYAPSTYVLLRVAADNIDSTKVLKFDGQPMFYSEEAAYINGVSTTAVFYTLIPMAGNTEGTGASIALAEDGIAKITAEAGERTTITRDGNVNGDDTINIADANVIVQLLHNMDYYGTDLTQLDAESRLRCDVDTGLTNVLNRGSIADVEAVLNTINQVS